MSGALLESQARNKTWVLDKEKKREGPFKPSINVRGSTVPSLTVTFLE